MATRLEKLLWSILCGTAIGLTGCYASDPPEDAGSDADVTDPVDADALDEREESPLVDAYGSPDYYADPLYGSPG